MYRGIHIKNPSKQSIQKESPTNKMFNFKKNQPGIYLLCTMTFVILEPKFIIQSLWKENLDWDDEISEELRNQFVKWKNSLHNWKTLEIPCWYQINQNCDLKDHIFTDTFPTLYGVVAFSYFREKCK